TISYKIYMYKKRGSEIMREVKKFLLVGIVTLLLLSSLMPVSIFGQKHIKQVKKSSYNAKINNPMLVKNTDFNIHVDKNLGRIKNRNVLSSSFEGWIYTKCDDVSKKTSILQGVFHPIDVDNNTETGPDGNDIQANFIIYPSIEVDNEVGWPGIVLVIVTTVTVKLLGDEIKDSSFEIYLELVLPDLITGSSSHRLRIGYYSPEDEEIPESLECSFKFKPHFFYDKKPEFIFGITPNSNNEIVVLLADYAKLDGSSVSIHRMFSAEYNPVISATIKITPAESEDVWGYTFTRDAERDTTATFSYEIEKTGDVSRSISLNIDKLPVLLSFELGLTPLSNDKGGSLKYRSNSEYDATFGITGSRLGICKYVTVKNIPKEIDAAWLPKIVGGYIDLYVSSVNSEISIKNNEEQAQISLSFTNLSGTINAGWEFNDAGTGSFQLTSEHTGAIMNLYWMLDNADIEIKTELKTTYFSTSWNVNY
ncbi:hypothetical protein MBGDN05_00756, partial [Thermoplasmatales archaeon SCGC AB-539-N05]